MLVLGSTAPDEAAETRLPTAGLRNVERIERRFETLESERGTHDATIHPSTADPILSAGRACACADGHRGRRLYFFDSEWDV